MPQSFFRFPEFADFTKFLFQLGKTPMFVRYHKIRPRDRRTDRQTETFKFRMAVKLRNYGNVVKFNNKTKTKGLQKIKGEIVSC